MTLYIDPGTGSMLFSIIIGIVATLFFSVKALFIKSKVWLSKDRFLATSDVQGASRLKYVIYNEGRQYWTVFQLVIEECERRGVPVLYVTSDEEDPIFQGSYQVVTSRYIGRGNKAYAYLNMLTADFVLMTTPSLDVYQLKRSKSVRHYSHLIHGVGDATLYRLYGLDYFDSVLLTGDYQAHAIRQLESMRGLPSKDLVTVGCTYLDVLSRKIQEVEVPQEHEFTVLVSPSWGPSALLSRYGERLLDPLVNTGMHIILRPHPQSRITESALLETLRSRYQDRANLEWDEQRDNIYALKAADIMISDFSGIIDDYTFLCDRPVIYATADVDTAVYDAGDLPRDEIWKFNTLKAIGVELREADFPQIGNIIRSTSDNPLLREARHKAKSEAWMYQGESGRRVVDYMVQVIEGQE